MNDSLDPLFRQAVAAIDAGDVAGLSRLISDQPRLVREPPWLLWFVAEDPERNGVLPGNIAEVARVIIDAARREAPTRLADQLDHALQLVAWSGVAARCGVQLALIDVLVDAGASLDGVPENALVNGHVAAASHLVDRGAPLTLATALGIGRWSEARRLAASADPKEKTDALVLSALNGNAQAIGVLLEAGVDVNAPSTSLYAHATPLHHAVCSGSLEAVRALVEAGAGLATRDKAEQATPLGWAEYYVGERTGKDAREYGAIAAYLRGQDGRG